jgi:hypothetical protein
LWPLYTCYDHLVMIRNSWKAVYDWLFMIRWLWIAGHYPVVILSAVLETLIEVPYSLSSVHDLRFLIHRSRFAVIDPLSAIRSQRSAVRDSLFMKRWSWSVFMIRCSCSAVHYPWFTISCSYLIFTVRCLWYNFRNPLFVNCWLQYTIRVQLCMIRRSWSVIRNPLVRKSRSTDTAVYELQHMILYLYPLFHYPLSWSIIRYTLIMIRWKWFASRHALFMIRGLLMTLLFAIRNSYSILRHVINDATLVIHGSLIPVYDPPFEISYSRFVLLDQRFVIRRSWLLVLIRKPRSAESAV